MKKRLIMLLALSIGIISSIVAQSAQTHIVARGETLTSIAKKYGTTTERIIELNPAAGQFVYVGMELKIPEVQQTEQVQPQQIIKPVETVQPQVPTTPSSSSEISETTLSDFSAFKLHYTASFDDFKHGAYGLGFHLLGMNESLFGITFNLYYNGGIIDPRLATVSTTFGPNIGGHFGNHFAVFMPLLVSLSLTGKGDGSNLDTFGWGLSLQPTGALRFGRFVIYAGIPVFFNPKAKNKVSVDTGYETIEVKTNVKKFTFGLELAVGFNL